MDVMTIDTDDDEDDTTNKAAITVRWFGDDDVDDVMRNAFENAVAELEHEVQWLDEHHAEDLDDDFEYDWKAITVGLEK